MHKFKVKNESRLIQGHVLDVARSPLLAALKSYDPQLYLKWNSKKREGMGCWELRRKPELKSALAGRVVVSPSRGEFKIPGDIFDMGDFTLSVPKYNENHVENHVKDFNVLSYEIVAWVAKHDLWGYGHKGSKAMHESEYREALYLNKIDEDSYAEKQYMIKQNRTQFNDFRQYILAGGDPTRLVDYLK